MRKLSCLLLSLILATSLALSGVATEAGAESALENKMSEDSTVTPYVAVYLKELEGEAKVQTLSDQRQTTIDEYVVSVLDSYYWKDVELVEHVQDYTTDSVLFLQIVSPDRTDKIKAMHSLEAIFNSGIDNECRELILKYFWRYAFGSGDAEAIAFLNANLGKANQQQATNMLGYGSESYAVAQEEIDTLSTTGSEYYNENFVSADAAAWAYENWDSSANTSLRDPNFPYFPDGNCTNFVSQALYHGGMLMHEEWYCYKKAGVGTLTLEEQAITEDEFHLIDTYWDVEDPSPWISASEFAEFWMDKCEDVFTTDRAGYLENQETIFSNSIYPGDVVILYNYSAAWIPIPAHVMIITVRDYANKDFLLAGNTNDRKDHPLATAISTFDTVVFFCL